MGLYELIRGAGLQDREPATEVNTPSCSQRARRAGRVLRGVSLLIILACVSVRSPGQDPSQDLSIQAHFRRAAEALKSGREDEAILEFRAVLEVDPANIAAHADLGSIAYLHGDCPTAVSELEPVLKGRPQLTKMQAILALCKKRMGDPSSDSRLQTSYDDLVEPKIGQELRTEVGIELADSYYHRGERDHALSVVQSLVGMSPDDPRVLYMAQRLYTEMAEDTLHKLMVIAPDSAIMQQVIAEKFVNSGDMSDAIQHYWKALQLNPSQLGVHYELAQALLQSSSTPSSLDGVKQELDMAVKTEGRSSKIESLLGRVALLEGDTQAALAHYERAHTLNCDDVEAELGLAKVLTMTGQHEKAFPYLLSAVQQEPMNLAAHYYLAQVYKAMHMAEEQASELKVFRAIQATRKQVEQTYLQMKAKTPMSEEDPSKP